jgi:hypothetical protein
VIKEILVNRNLSVLDSDDDDNDDRGVVDTTPHFDVKFPYFDNNKSWPWDQYVKIHPSNEDQPPTLIPKNYLPTTTNIPKSSIINQIEFLGIPDTKENRDQVFQQITFHLKTARRIIKSWLNKFFVEFSQEMGIKCPTSDGNGRVCTTVNDLKEAIISCETLDEVKRFFHLLYLTFDYMPNCNKIIAKLVMKQLALKIDPGIIATEREEILKKHNDSHQKSIRMTKNCFEKLIPKLLADVRKQYTTLIYQTFGTTFTMKRKYNVKKGNEHMIVKRTNRLLKKEYEWMISGQFVSKIRYIILLDLVKANKTGYIYNRKPNHYRS